MATITINLIEYLRANLRDRYKNCYAVLKELLQNADDAGATELHVAAIDQLAGAGHPLLAGPLLVVVNNAPFTYANASAIQTAGVGSKGLDDSKIGKFGLGLKSVFHLCEAFFYLSDPRGDTQCVDDRLKSFKRREILNPWLGEFRYSSWDTFTVEDQNRLEALARQFLTDKTDDWFLICLPLRKRSHCMEDSADDPKRWAIDPRWYGDEPQPPKDIFSQAHYESICEMLPLMSTLDRVFFWQLDSSDSTMPSPTVEIVRHATQAVNWRHMKLGRQCMSGNIQSTGEIARTWNYVGVQELLDRKDLRDLSNRDDWPWMDAQTESGRKRDRATVKQHSAIVFLETAGNSDLQVEHTVFLPLGDSPQPRQQSNNNTDFTLLRHGYFFVDAGRLAVDFAATQEKETARQAWNRILDREGTLPLVVPSLVEYSRKIRGQNDSDTKLRLVTSRLWGHSLWKNHSQQICRDGIWGFRLLGGGGEWCQVAPDLQVVLLPGNAITPPNLPFKVFPALTGRASSVMLTFNGLPRLTPSVYTPWDQPLAAALFESVPVVEVIKHDDQLAYLYEVSRDFCQRGGHAFQIILRTLLRRFLREVRLSDLRDRHERFSQLVALLSNSLIVPMPYKADLVRESERVFETLTGESTEVLPIPDIFCDPRAERQPGANAKDVRVLLKAVSGLAPSGAQEDAFHSLVGQSIMAILAAWKREGEKFLSCFGDLPLFYARNYARDNRRAYTAEQLNAKRERRLLFGRQTTMCKRLQSCLKEDEILFVAEKEMVDLLRDELGPIPLGDVTGCVQLLEQRPELTEDIVARQSMLSAILPSLSESGDERVRGVLRYLLHGNRHASPESVDLFVGGSSAWCAAAQWVLEATRELWRIISPDLADIRPSDADRLLVRKCDSVRVPPLFRLVRPDALDQQRFRDQPVWRNQLLKEWPDDDTETLKRLPLFVATDGSMISVSEQTFIQGDMPPPPPEIIPNLILIVDPKGVVESRGLVPKLAVDVVLRRVLARDNCRQHWNFILESIPESPTPELRNDLLSAAWLPTPDGRGIAPRRVVSRDGLQEYVRQLRGSRRPLLHKYDLPSVLLNHPRWKFIENLGPKGDDLYRLLGEALEGSDAFALGREVVAPEGIVAFVQLFAEPQGLEVMPVAGLLKQLLDGRTEVTELISKHIYPAVRAPLTAPRTENALYYLSTRHQQLAGQERTLALDTFNRLLKEGLSLAGFTGQLRNLFLLNQGSQWCPAEELAACGDNVASSHLLHRSHYHVLDGANFWASAEQTHRTTEDGNSTPAIQLDPKALAKSATLLGDYLQAWKGEDVPDDALAAVIAILGNHDGYPQQYEKFRDSRPLEAMRTHFTWHFAAGGLEQWMDTYHYCILPADKQFVRVRNLFGNEIKAPVNKQVTSLFDGFGTPSNQRFHRLPNGHFCFQIWLRPISPDDLSREDKLRILANTVASVRGGVYGEWDEDFASKWQRLTQFGQLEIEIAQDMILESSAMLLESQLSVRQSEKLKTIFAKWHRVRQRAKAAEHSKNESEEKAAAREKVGVLKDLRSQLVTDVETQHLLVSEIRKKLKDNSYGASSIPFELFQNGDDAVVELEKLCVDKGMLARMRPDELRHRFVIDATGVVGSQACLRLAHWGRGINQFRVGTSDGRDHGFDRDMERMLVLQGSGKDESSAIGGRTGKFGLGFKSVFFVCDEPRVLSGARSRFRVVAGIYPDSLEQEEERRLEKVLEEAGDPGHKGTIVELLLREPANVEQSLERFEALAGYLVVFARRIRQCNLSKPQSSQIVFDWQPSEVAPHTEVGNIRIGPEKTRRCMVLRLGADRYGAMLVPIDATGVDLAANAGVSKIWVTTPTEEHNGSGCLLVNGLFDVNPGRTQLRETDHNDDLALRMGQEAGELLCGLFAQSGKDWERLRERLGCTQASRSDFWASFWKACLPYSDPKRSPRVLWKMLFGSEHSGAYRLAREAAVIPTGLPGPYACLTSLRNVRWQTDGALRDTEVWINASESPWVKEKIHPGAIVSRSVADGLKQFWPQEARCLSLATVLRETMPQTQCVEPAAANDLGKLLYPKRLREISRDRSLASEEQEIHEVLAAARFRNAAGTWRDANSLLIGHVPENRLDEHRRAAFAPEDNLLAQDYQGDAIEFFLACRKEMQASAEQMTQWLLIAKDDRQRKAGLEYMERGELSFAIRQCLAGNERALNASWLGDRLVRQGVMSEMDADRQAVVLGMLKKAGEIGPVALAPVAEATRPTADILRDIHTWWRTHRDDILVCHDRTVYPDGRLPNLSFKANQEELASDLTVRKQWMILFMLGSLYPLGNRGMRARGFLDLCEERGWLEILAGRADNPAGWFRVMDDYLDSLQGDSRYFHWMNQFLAYYQVARWLPSYARAFEAVTRPGVRLDNLGTILDIANLRTSHVFAGSTGFDAPPCSRTMGLGSHFVLREVIRARMQQSESRYRVAPRLAQLAYVPSARVRRLLAQITRDSEFLSAALSREQLARRIAEVLRKYLGEDADFDQAFDIPLHALTWRQFADTRQRILGIDDGSSEGNPLACLFDETEEG